ncbi:MAG: hypothetical protein QOC66_3969 [Pseudonocardiales bacterium]|nr:hypothetical protein [Pseudonocardiales bacterium]
MPVVGRVVTRPLIYRLPPAYVAPLFAVATAVAFLIASPPVGDLFAAQARQSAATHGVGLRYWFSWFGGTVPGHYSVLGPLLSRLADVRVLGAVATVLITPLCYRLVKGSRHPALATWLAAIGASLSLWSGRVPFAVGTVLMLVALLTVRGNRRYAAAAAGAATVLVSPVSGVFLILGIAGIYLHDPARRTTTVLTSAAAGVVLISVAAYFGMPGTEGFPLGEGLLTAATLAAMLLARPPAYLQTVLVISILACPLLVLVPNGMGSNFERFSWLCLPVAVAATARSKLPVLLLTTLFALSCTIGQTVKDLNVASKPISNTSYYASLIAELDRTSNLPNYRIEVIPDGTHVAAYALLNHAQLARGYETQSDNTLNAVLSSPALDATTYKRWLDDNAVGYVVINETTLKTGPEDRLVRAGGLPYLTLAWSDPHWKLYRVADPNPIAAPPARVVDADQASLVIETPHAATTGVRIRWSRFLHVAGPGAAQATLRSDGQGWTTLITHSPGRYVLTG